MADPRSRLADGGGFVSFSSKARSHATGPDFHDYHTTLDLLNEIDDKESQISITARRVLLAIAKKAEDTEYWPRLLKSKGKAPNVKVDWSKWVDEDEEEKKDDVDLGDLQNLQNFGGGAGLEGLAGAAGGLGGAVGGPAGFGDDDDSDDEDLPDLEPAEEK